jgi:hypothetical protein
LSEKSEDIKIRMMVTTYDNDADGFFQYSVSYKRTTEKHNIA